MTVPAARKRYRAEFKVRVTQVGEADLRSLSPVPHSSTRPRCGAKPAPNLLEQEQPSTVNHVWACDLTQFKVCGGLLQAVFIIDLCSRYIVGGACRTRAILSCA